MRVAVFLLLASAWQEPEGAVAQQPCSPSAALPRLSLGTTRSGRLQPGSSTCVGLSLQRGEFTRIRLNTEIGYLKARLLDPDGKQLQVTWMSAFSTAAPSLPLVIEAPVTGLYAIELSVPQWVSFTTAQSFTVEMYDWTSSEARALQRRQAATDERLQSLRDNAHQLRTIDPSSSTFEDLEFLRETLSGVRVVLLGESENGGGSDVLAKTRLVKFLHERMGFDVLAFQAGLHSASVASHALSTGVNPRDAMANAGLGLLIRSVQAEPLLEYLAARARTDRPLDVSGFDSQFTGTAANRLVDDLRGFLAARRVESPLSDSISTESRIVFGTIAGQYRSRSTLPSVADQHLTIQTLRSTAATIERVVQDREGRFWSQVLRSAAVQLGLALNNARGASTDEFMRGFIRQLADNLKWLVTVAYPERKIIVWSHSVHAVRNPTGIQRVAGPGYTVGQGLWEAIGSQSYAIGFTSYNGRSHWMNSADDYYQDLIPEQLGSAEFETLMSNVGHEYAFIDLRTARTRNSWLGGRFITSALHLVPEEAEWSLALDALLFIRTQDPRTRSR